MSGSRRRVAVAVAVARQPSLWGTALRQLRRTAETGWWRRFPPLPTPPAEYVRFRVITHGGSSGAVDPHDVVNYLAWCKRWHADLRGVR